MFYHSKTLFLPPNSSYRDHRIWNTHRWSQSKDHSSHSRKQQHTLKGLLSVLEALSVKLNWFASFFSGFLEGGASSFSTASAASAVPDSSAVSSPAACNEIEQWLHPERTWHLFPSSEALLLRLLEFFCPVSQIVTEDSICKTEIRRLPAITAIRFWNGI